MSKFTLNTIKKKPPRILNRIERLADVLIDRALAPEANIEFQLDAFKALVTYAGIANRVAPPDDEKGEAFNAVQQALRLKNTQRSDTTGERRGTDDDSTTALPEPTDIGADEDGEE